MRFFSGLELNFAGHRHSRTDVAYPCTTHTHTHTHTYIYTASQLFLFEYIIWIFFSYNVFLWCQSRIFSSHYSGPQCIIIIIIIIINVEQFKKIYIFTQPYCPVYQNDLVPIQGWNLQSSGQMFNGWIISPLSAMSRLHQTGPLNDGPVPIVVLPIISWPTTSPILHILRLKLRGFLISRAQLAST